MTAEKEKWKQAIGEDFLESSAAVFAAPYIAGARTGNTPTDGMGVIVGRYRLVREIGRGGMGSVWLAERADGQFEQLVALKLIRRGMDSDDLLARFLRERQILAGLVHPNVARLLDGGVSDDGRPYFVMEHVAGTPITAYSDARSLGIAERLRLFVVTCGAVQYAHQSLVVHLDIKPSNVLVTDAGEVKLLDFGVARLLRENEGDASAGAIGAGAGHALTPEYASPEQLTGGSITTASDVFQLGVLLCELLTGRRPERGERRNRTPHRLHRPLRGDLNAITAHALQKEPGNRYPSAQALAEDVERHLRHLPIRAGVHPPGYRLAKYLRRYRLRATAAALLIVASVIAGSAYLVQIRSERDRALREAAKASESAALLSRFFQGWSPDAADRGRVNSETVLSDAVQRAEHDHAENPEMLAAALSELGDLYAGLGRVDTADSLLARAMSLQEKLSRTPSADYAATLGRRGRLLLTKGHFREAELELRRSLAMYRSIFSPRQAEVLRAQHDLAGALYPQEKLTESEAVLRDALSNSPAIDSPITTEISAMLGYVLFRQARYAEASAILRPTLERQRRIFGRVHQATQRTINALASSLRERRFLAEAEALSRDALDIARALYGDNHLTTHYSTLALAVLLERKGDFVEAEVTARTAVAQAERLFGESNLNTALALRTLGGVLLVQEKRGEAELLLRRARAGIRKTFPEGHPDEGDILNRLTYILVARGALDAREMYAEAVAFEKARAPSAPFFVTDGYEYLGWSAHRMGDATLAEHLTRRAVGLYEGELPDGHPYRAQSSVWLAQTLLNAGRTAEAQSYLLAGLDQWRSAGPSQSLKVDEVQRLLRSSGRR